MKKLIYIAGAALVMLASASCEKKETVKEAQSSVEKTEMVFTATSESALKTTIVDGTKAVWSSTDNLKVFTAVDQTGSVCNYKSGAGTNTAEFQGQCAKKGPWTAICPAIEGSTYSAGTITFTMPETQTYAANTFAAGAMPCVAYSETNTFNFKHSFGVLKLSLKLKSGKTGSVKSITVTTKGSEKLNGTFTVNPQTGVAATYSTGGTSSVTLNCTSVALSESTATDFWIVVPQGAFASGFDVTVTPTSEDLLPATLSTTKANTIKAGEVNKMPVQIIAFKKRPDCQKALDDDANWVTIGTQQWLKVNTKCIEYDTESEAFYASWLTNNTIPTSSSYVFTPYYADPTTASKPSYMSDEQFANLGMMYNWAAAVGLEDGQTQAEAFTGNRQGICPNGSHVPSGAEWNTLATTLGGASVAGKKMKTSTGWQSGTGEGDNGFAALPAGYVRSDREIVEVRGIGTNACYWPSDAKDSYNVYYRYILNTYDNLRMSSVVKYNAYSVRCLRD
ncbi:MAG: hypothetical protein MJ007_07220 [Paludibacteraceae bacterium]|nr:hypothetical protein [Paludibacteraceae bacterium]